MEPVAHGDPSHADHDTSTMPRLLARNARVRGRRPAVREKDLGIWQTWTWSQVLVEVEALAAGLSLLGLERGGHLAVVGDNRPRLYWSMTAAQALGAVPVPLYQDAIASEMQFVLEDAEATIAIAEDQEQVDKLLEMLPGLPHLKHIVYDDSRGLRHYASPMLVSLDELRRRGAELVRLDPSFFARHVDAGSPDDVAVMLYTSGTTSRPKGVRQTHRAFIDAASGDVAFDGFTERDEVLSYLPMAWIGDHLFSYAEALVAGYCVNCPESADTVMTDLPRDRPDLLLRAAARLREPADAGHDPHGRRGPRQARAVSHVHGRREALRRRPARRQAGRPRRPRPVRDRRARRLRAAEERARHEPAARRLHRRRGDRAGPVRLLSLDRHQPEAALRPDRDVRVRLPAEGRRGAARHGRPPDAPASRCASRPTARCRSARRDCSTAITSGRTRRPRRCPPTAGS